MIAKKEVLETSFSDILTFLGSVHSDQACSDLDQISRNIVSDLKIHIFVNRNVNKKQTNNPISCKWTCPNNKDRKLHSGKDGGYEITPDRV